MRLSTSWPYVASIVSGGFCVALGFMALVGWHTHNLTLIRSLPASAPTYYNTALGFFLCGTGLLAVMGGWVLMARVVGSLVVVLGLGTLTQYFFGLDLGIDQLAMEDVSGFANPYPGRMAPTTAACLALSGAALLLINGRTWQGTSAAVLEKGLASASGQRFHASKAALLELLGVILTVSGLVTCVLYLIGATTAYSWGRVVNMSVAGAVGFAVLGMGILTVAWRENRMALFSVSPWLSALVGIAVITVTLLLYQALLVQERRHVERTTRVVAASVRGEVTAGIDARILALAHMAQRWEYAGAPSRTQWESEATLNLRHFPGYLSIAWVDPTFEVRWLVASDATQAVDTLRGAFSQYAQHVLQAARTQNTVTALPAINLMQNGKGFAVLVSLWQGQDFAGFIVGVFACQDLLEALLKNIATSYAVAIFSDGEEMYRRSAAGGQDEAEWGQETTIDPYGVTWRARVWPVPKELARQQSALPEMTLGVGLVIATLLAWMVALTQTARQRAQETTTAYVLLSGEMAERQRAEEGLHKAHAELELRVQERTVELARANDGLRVENRQRRRAEEALARQARELARSNSELEHFAHVASHDLQEPLRKIQAFGDRLQLKCSQDLGEQGRGYLEHMQSSAARMQTLIDDLLTLALVTTRPRPFVPVDLVAVARTVVSDMEVRLQEVGGTVQVDSLPTIDADPGQMGQLLQNLIGNALKFHRNGEPPVVKVWGALLQDQGPGAGNDGSSPQQCGICVEDNGIGFDEKYLSQIFQPFQRLFGRREYEGTGMGLAICRAIVERHGGDITARSTPGQGTTFIITLPAQQSNKETSQWPNGEERLPS